MRGSPTTTSTAASTQSPVPMPKMVVNTPSVGRPPPGSSSLASKVTTTALAIALPTALAMELTLLATPVSSAATSATSNAGIAA